jgi:hypothetical protein
MLHFDLRPPSNILSMQNYWFSMTYVDCWQEERKIACARRSPGSVRGIFLRRKRPLGQYGTRFRVQCSTTSSNNGPVALVELVKIGQRDKAIVLK